MARPKQPKQPPARRDADPDIDRLYARMRDADAILRSKGRDATKIMERPIVKTGLETLAVAGSAGAIGIIAGRTGNANIGRTPLPLGLTVGVALQAANLMGWVPKQWAPLVSNIANGSVAGWGALQGASYGQAMAEQAGDPGVLRVGGASVAGMSGIGACGPSCPPTGPCPNPCPPGPPRELMPPNRAPGQWAMRAPLTEPEIAAISARYR